MRKTLFAGLTVLDDDESLVDDGAAFIQRDRDTIDHFLEIGAKTHRHNAAPALVTPVVGLGGSALGSGGSIPASVTMTLAYTLLDGDNGETTISPTTTVTTNPPIPSPLTAPSASADYAAGSLTPDTYYYARAFVDNTGGETPVGPVRSVEREPGFVNGRVLLSQLAAGSATAGAIAWRLYRAVGGSQLHYLASGTQDTYIDDGSVSVNCDVSPVPDGSNTTGGDNSLLIRLPDPANLDLDAEAIRVYLHTGGDFVGDVLLEQFPLASAGQHALYRSIVLTEGSPPDVATSVGGASKIDPDTDILDWHWKRPVDGVAFLGSGGFGDVRLDRTTGRLWGMLRNPSGSGAAEWTHLGSSVGGGGGGTGDGSVRSVDDPDGPVIWEPDHIRFRGSGGASVGVTDAGGGSALVDISATPGPQGIPGAIMGSAARRWASATVNLAASGSGMVALTGSAAGMRILEVSTSHQARVRLYGTSADRTADSGRALGTDPSGDHGLLMEMRTVVGELAWRLSPAIDAHNLDNPPVNQHYLSVQNLDGSTQNVVVAVHYVPTEVY